MRANPIISTQKVWAKPLRKKHNRSYGQIILQGAYSCLEKDRGPIRLILEHVEPKEDDYEGEPLPFEYDESITENELYIKNLVGWKN